jgi:hypothetical protein
LFGCVYFAVKGVWTHAIAALLLALATAGISWLVYPFFATEILRTHYLRHGWLELSDRWQEPIITDAAITDAAEPRSNTGRNILLALLFFLIAVAVASVWVTGIHFN